MAAALVFVWLPAAWPNPLAPGTLDQARALPRLRAAAMAVDAACARGDQVAFAALTTSEHRRQLSRRLQVVDRELDGAALRELGDGAACAMWFAEPVLAFEVRGARAALAVARPAGDGAELLSFVWDGWRWRFDGVRHATNVRNMTSAAAAVAEVAAAPVR